MSSRSRSFKFDNVTKQISIAGQIVSDGSSSTPIVSGNLSSNTQSNITAVGTLASLTVSGNISAANYNYANGVSILAGVIANAGAQSGQIVSANTAMKGYVDGQITTTTSAISTANTAMVGYVGQQVTTANTALKGYVDGQITNLVNGAPSTLDTINELAAALGNDANLSVTLTSYIGNVNANIGTANLALKGYIDNQITVLTSNTAITSEIANLWSNAAVQAGSIADLLANAGAQSASIATLTSNAAVQSGDIATIYANLGTVSGALATLTSNAAVQAGAIATLTANAASQSGDIATLFANAGAQSGAIVAANTAMKGYVDGQILTVGIGGSNYSNSNVAAYLPTYNGVITASNVTVAGNVSATYFLGNGSQLTGIVTSGGLSITSNTSSQATHYLMFSSAAGAVTTANISNPTLTWTPWTQILETGQLKARSRVTAGGAFPAGAGSVYVADGSDNVKISLDADTGNVVASGNIIASGILTNNYYYANGTPITFGGGSSTYTDSNVAAYLTTNQYAVIGNITTANTAMKGYVDGQITTLTSNAAVQAGLIADTNTAITTANTAMKGYVDGQISTTTSAISTANTALKGYVDGQITTLTSNAAVQAGQITSANTAMKGYVDGQISGLINSAPGTLDTLNEIAIALGNDANLSATLTSMILDVQTEVSTANTAMKGYVDVSVSSIPTSKISDSNSNVSVTADYINVAINSTNIASFSSDGVSTTGNVTLANSQGGAGARMTFNPTANSIDFYFG